MTAKLTATAAEVSAMWGTRLDAASSGGGLDEMGQVCPAAAVAGEVFHRSTLQPDQEWLEFLDALGSDTAIAIDRGRSQQASPDGARQTRTPMPDLSRLERDILAYVVEGLPNRVIAEKVHLSTHTIKFHVGQMLDKVGVSNRTELARKATQEGWL